MSAAPLPVRPPAVRWDDLSDRVNPAVVKDLRQGLRTRVFWVSFALVLLACLVVSLVVWTQHRATPWENTGRGALAAYLVCMAVVHFFILPFNLYLSLLRERRDGGWGLLSMTGLGPRRLLHGKYLAHLAQAALYASAAVPFLLFSYYLNGVDVPTLLCALALGGAWCALLLGAAMFCGGMAFGPTVDKAVDALTTFLLIGALLFGAPLGFAVTLGLAGYVAGDPKSALLGVAAFGWLFCGMAMLALELSVDFVARLNERDAKPGKYLPAMFCLGSGALGFTAWLVVRL